MKVETEPAQKRRGGKSLFLAPQKAREIGADRTNGGSGYTVDELDALYMNGGYGATQFRHWPEKGAYLEDPSHWLLEPTKLQPFMEPKRYARPQLEAIERELTTRLTQIEKSSKEVAANKTAIATTVKAHLWCTAELVGPATQALEQVLHRLKALERRFRNLRTGYGCLPREA